MAIGPLWHIRSTFANWLQHGQALLAIFEGSKEQQVSTAEN
jgi:hypothetical protein